MELRILGADNPQAASWLANHDLGKPGTIQTDQVFVASADGRVVGAAQLSYFNIGGRHHYGILHVLELDNPPASNANEVVAALLDKCQQWLMSQCPQARLYSAPVPGLESLLTLAAIRAVRAVQMPPAREGSPQPIQSPPSVWA